MKICVNGVIREMTAEEIAAIEAIPVEAVQYDEIQSTANAVKILLTGKTPETDAERIRCGALYPVWQKGSHAVGEIYLALDDLWECYQAYDNAVYPDITPGNAAWYTFNRPLHGNSRETARAFVQPTGAHDMYHTGEYMIYEGKLYLCLQDTAYSPAEYAAAWEKQ